MPRVRATANTAADPSHGRWIERLTICLWLHPRHCLSLSIKVELPGVTVLRRPYRRRCLPTRFRHLLRHLLLHLPACSLRRLHQGDPLIRTAPIRVGMVMFPVPIRKTTACTLTLPCRKQTSVAARRRAHGRSQARLVQPRLLSVRLRLRERSQCPCDETKVYPLCLEKHRSSFRAILLCPKVGPRLSSHTTHGLSMAGYCLPRRHSGHRRIDDSRLAVWAQRHTCLRRCQSREPWLGASSMFRLS